MQKSFEPFLQPFEKEKGYDTRRFSSTQCMDLYRAFDTAMKSDSEDLKNTAMEAGKSAYHHILYAGVESGDGKKIKGSYLTGIMETKPFESIHPQSQKDLLYELAKGVRIEEQIGILKKFGKVMKKAAEATDRPQTDQQWNTLCNALQTDEALQNPGHFLAHTLHFKKPKAMNRTIRNSQDRLHEYLEANGLPHTYEELKAYAETVTEKPVKELEDLKPKTQWDVPFDQICTRAYEDDMPVKPFDAIRCAMREAWLIDRMEPGDQKNRLINSFFERAYDTIHYETHAQTVEGQKLQWPKGLDGEIKSDTTHADARRKYGSETAAFLKEYEVYEEKRNNENLTLTDEDLQAVKSNGLVL